MNKVYFPLFLLLILTSVGRAAPVSHDVFADYRMPGGAIGGFLDPAFYVGAFYRTQYSDHVHLGGKVIWPYLFDSKTRKTFGFVGLQLQHSTHKDGEGQGVVGLRHLWGRHVITGTFLGYGTALPHAGSGWLHDAFGGLDFYLGMFSLTGVYHYPWVERNAAKTVPNSFYLHLYKDGLARMHYQTLESLAYRGGEMRAGAEFLPNADLRVGYFYYTAPEVPELQGPDVTLTYEHIFGHVLARAEGLVRYDLREGWSGRVGLWIGLDRTPLKHGGVVGRFGEFPMFDFDFPIRTITRDAIVGLNKPGTITEVGTEEPPEPPMPILPSGARGAENPNQPGLPGGGGAISPYLHDLPNLPSPVNPNLGYTFVYVQNETELNTAVQRTDVDVVLINGQINLTAPVVQSPIPKAFAGSGIVLNVGGVTTLVPFPGNVHHLVAAAGEPLILGSGSPLYFHYVHLTVSDNGTLIDYSQPPLAVGTRFIGGPDTYGTVLFYHNTVDASGGTDIYANGESFNKIAHQKWIENTINADLLTFDVSAGAEFFVDVFEGNTVTSPPQTNAFAAYAVYFSVDGADGKLHVGKVVKNKLTNMSFKFLANEGGVMDVGDVVENTVEGQTFRGYAFYAMEGASLTLASFVKNSGATSIPAGSYSIINPIDFYAGSKGKLTVTGDTTENNFSNSTESNDIVGSAVWLNRVEEDGEITFEGAFSQNTLEHTDRPTGTPAGTATQNAILWFKAETGGQIVVKGAVSNNTLIAEGYFGGLWLTAENKTAFAAEHTETKIDIQKEIDHLTFQGDSLYGLPGVETETYIVFIKASEALNTPINVHVHLGGITDSNISYGPWGQGFKVIAKSGPTQGDAVVTLDAVDDNQFTNNYEKDPATGDFINQGGGEWIKWELYTRNTTLTLNSFKDNSFQLNNAVGAMSIYIHPFGIGVFRGGKVIVQNANGNVITSLGPHKWSTKIVILWGGMVDLGADFRTNNPTFTTNEFETQIYGGTLIW